jgi:hypothetical protein
MRLRFFGRFYKILLRFILTPPKKRMTPTKFYNPPQQGNNCEPKSRPQGPQRSTPPSLKTKQQTNKAKGGDLDYARPFP